MKRIFEWIIRPFKEEFWFFLLIWILSAMPAIIFGIQSGEFLKAFNFICKALVVSYLLALVCGSFNQDLSRIFKIITVVFCFLSMVIDAGMYEVCLAPFQDETVAIILGTNLEEAAGFFDTYVTWPVVLVILAVSLVALSVFLLRDRIADFSSKVWTLLLITFIILCPFSIYHKPLLDVAGWKSVSVLKTLMFLEYENTEDLHYQVPSPSIVCGDDSPQNIIVVFGESLSKSHCSLYGYEKRTQPLLEKFAKKDSLIIFPDVTSAYYTTILSFCMMLSEMNSEDSTDALYDKNNVFDYFKAAGYHSSWISNQSSVGIFDNLITKLAALADTTTFVGEYGKGWYKKDFDELVVPSFKSQISCSHTGKNIFFIHLMGQHPAYKYRYPEAYCRFKVSDYSDKPEHQRALLSEYDNSILYNDKVVRELMDVAKDKEAILLYVPDHGQDIFESNPNHCGHAQVGSLESIEYGERIPMMIYCTTKYKERYSAEYEYLKVFSQQPFNTTNLLPMLLQIADITNIEN